MLSILFVVIAVTGCKKDDDVTPDPIPINESEVLVKYLESSASPLGKDYVSTDMPAMILASEVYTLNQTGQVYIIDIRAAADFTTGHIQNAVNVALGDLLTHIDGVDLTPYTKVAIVCYSGQSASYGTSLLRLVGYGNVYTMKFGMCSWHTDFAGSWNNNTSNMYATQFTDSNYAKGPAGAMPTLNTGKTTGQEILMARVNTLLAEGFTPAKVSKTVVFANLSTYYIANYWSATHYTDPGHIPGAMQYTPKLSMQFAEDLKTLPTDKPIVIYCYTGQTSAHLTAYLRLLGYDAKSLLFGANGMIYDELINAGGMPTWKASAIMDYTYI